MNRLPAILTLLAPLVFAAGESLSPPGRTEREKSTPPAEYILSNQFMLVGEVISRMEDRFTVLSVGSQLTTVRVGDDTEITKGAISIELSEIAVGDKVSVTVMRSADGGLQAVRIAVRTGYE